jgi:hypothetical protein
MVDFLTEKNQSLNNHLNKILKFIQAYLNIVSHFNSWYYCHSEVAIMFTRVINNGILPKYGKVFPVQAVEALRVARG